MARMIEMPAAAPDEAQRLLGRLIMMEQRRPGDTAAARHRLAAAMGVSDSALVELARRPNPTSVAKLWPRLCHAWRAALEARIAADERELARLRRLCARLDGADLARLEDVVARGEALAAEARGLLDRGAS